MIDDWIARGSITEVGHRNFSIFRKFDEIAVAVVLTLDKFDAAYLADQEGLIPILRAIASIILAGAHIVATAHAILEGSGALLA
jgi:hypothetical protein